MNLKFFKYNKLDEIVFAHRNKQYGAYLLRKTYDQKITRSTIIVCVLALIVGFSYKIFIQREEETRKIDLTLYEGFDLRMEQNIIKDLPGNEKNVPHEDKKAETKTEENTKPEEETKVEEIKPNPELELKPKEEVITKPDDKKNNLNQDPKADTAKTAIAKGNENSTSTGKADSVQGKGASTLMINRKGGLEEFVAWIQQNFVYPNAQTKLEYDCTIWVDLYINVDGSLNDIKISKKVSSQYYNDEVLRVAKSYTGWFITGFGLDPSRKDVKRVGKAIKIYANPEKIK